jgi:hypothetical protein
MPRAILQVFEIIETLITTENAEMELYVNYYEIYNETFNDLLSITPERGTNLKLRETPKNGYKVLGDNTIPITSFEDFFRVLMIGQKRRSVASTGSNERSSRSHTILVLKQICKTPDGRTKSSKMNMIDLAGSERLTKT